MRTTIFIISIILLTSCTGGRETTQTTSRMTQDEESVMDSTRLKNFIESGSFEFKVIRVTGQQTQISSGYYFLRIDHGIAESYLPFFGESIRYDFSGEGGIVFNTSMTDYKVVYNSKKDFYSITFKIYDPKDQYQIYLDIYKLDNASLRINSTNKSPMSYTGIIEEINRPKPRKRDR
jgi:hypothetical protein